MCQQERVMSNLPQLYQKKHQLWLELALCSFATKDEEMKSRLYEFSLLAFRHMKWISSQILAKEEEFNYDRDAQTLHETRLFPLLYKLQDTLNAINKLYPNDALKERLRSDDIYILEYISQILKKDENNLHLTAFDRKREWQDKELPQEQLDALTLFLFEEFYKEYELILVYNYMQARTQSALHLSVYEDLIAESHFHFKSFGEMMAKMGILTLPRELHPMTYIVKDLTQFVKDGIAEEEAAKEMCRELSSKIKDEELSKFFDFINAQESYHIELMKKLL